MARSWTAYMRTKAESLECGDGFSFKDLLD